MHTIRLSPGNPLHVNTPFNLQEAIMRSPLSDKELSLIVAYWRAANYLFRRRTVDDQGGHRRGGTRARPVDGLYERFSSRGTADFGDKLLSAMRCEFGGHFEKAPE